ncbi:MAG: hypothetical protein AB7L76_05605 [Burkholderiaceae bacterium]
MSNDQLVLTGPGAPVVLAATWEIEAIAKLLATLSDVDTNDCRENYWAAFRQISSVAARLTSVNSAVMSIADGEATPEDLHQYARVIKSGCAVYSLPDGWPEARTVGGRHV